MTNINRRDFFKLTTMAMVAPTSALEVLSDRPFNAQTPPHLLHDEITPVGKLFIRNNGTPPTHLNSTNIKDYSLEITGAINKKSIFTLEELKKNFKSYTYNLVLECAGNGRAAYRPKIAGNQWTYGAIGQPQWTGVRLADVLKAANGVSSNAVYIGYYGHDTHLSGDSKLDAISRGIPLKKAFEDTTIVAYAMNGKDIPMEHGYPLRLIAPGYPASVSGKWLKQLKVCEKIHDGAKMTGDSYKLPRTPLAPGEIVPVADMVIIEEMPVKSLITFPQSGLKWSVAKHGKNFILAGKAWSGVGVGLITKVEISDDFGCNWYQAKVNPAKNAFAWQTFEIVMPTRKKGYNEFWVRAYDRENVQPMVVPAWNQKGYCNNAAMRISATFI